MTTVPGRACVYEDESYNEYFVDLAADSSVRARHPGQYKIFRLNRNCNRTGVGSQLTNPWCSREKAEENLERMAKNHGWKKRTKKPRFCCSY